MMKGTRDFSGRLRGLSVLAALIELNDGELRHSGDFMVSACLAVILLVVGFGPLLLPWLLAQAKGVSCGERNRWKIDRR